MKTRENLGDIESPKQRSSLSWLLALWFLWRCSYLCSLHSHVAKLPPRAMG